MLNWLLFSRLLHRSGTLRLLELLPTPPGILVINHHRIGDDASTRFDRGVYSQTQAGLEEQVRMIRRRMPIVAGEELEALVTRSTPLTRTHAVITFDDGYLDSYTNAFPVLQSLGVPGIFFPITDFAGTANVPWWDEIAYLVRNTQATTIAVQTPEPLQLHVGNDRETLILQLLRHYKKPSNRDSAAFLQQLRESTGCTVPHVGRRFLNWDEARIMAAAGMEFGSHTCSHTVLSQQAPETQRWELVESKKILERELGSRIHSLAYPVGSTTAFTQETEDIAAQAGYTMAFAFHGNWNPANSLRPTYLHRISPAIDTDLFRTEVEAVLHTRRA